MRSSALPDGGREISFFNEKSRVLALCSSSRRRKKRAKKAEDRAIDHVVDQAIDLDLVPRVRIK